MGAPLPQLDWDEAKRGGEAVDATPAQAATWAEGKSVMSYARAIAHEGLGFAKNIEEGTLGALTMSDPTQMPNFTGQLMRGVGIQKPKGLLEQGLVRSTALAGTYLEMMGIGKLASAAEFAAEPIGSALSPAFRGIVKAAAKIAGKKLTANAADAATTRILSSAIAGGAIVPAMATVATSVQAGKPTLPRVGPNAALGMFFGALGGMYDGDARVAIAGNFDKMQGTLSAVDREGVAQFDNLSRRIGRVENMPPKEVSERLAAIMVGKGSDAMHIAVQNEAAVTPELFRHSLMRRLLDISNGKTSAALEVPPQADVYSLMASFGSPSPIDGAFDGHSDVIPETNPLAQNTPEPLYEGDMGIPPPPQKPRQLTYQPVIKLPDQSAPQPTKPLPNGFEHVEVPTTDPDFAPAIAMGPQTLGGTPIAAPGTEALLPAGNAAPLDMPNAPQLQKPAKLTPFQRTAIDLSKGGDFGALEKHATKNGAARVSFNGLLVRGMIKPEHVTTSDTANTIAGILYDNIDAVADSPEVTDAKLAQLQELMQAFQKRGAELRGETSTPVTQYLREPVSGEIVRSIQESPVTKTLIDKSGRKARVKTTAVKPPVVAELPPVLDMTNSEHLTQLETVLNGEKLPTIEVGPSPGPSPALTAQKARYLAARGDKIETAAPEKPVVVKGKVRSEAAQKASLAARLKSEKGALSVPRGTRIRKTGVSDLAERMGGEVWRVPEGIVIRHADGAESPPFPSGAAAMEYMRRHITISRMSADADDVAESAVAHLDPKSTKYALKLGKKALAVHIENIDAQLALTKQLSKQISAAGGGEAAPFFIRHTPGAIAQIRASGIMRNHAFLMSYGEGGERLANLSDLYSTTYESIENYMVNRVAEVAHFLKRVATTRQIEDGTAAHEALDLFDKVVAPLFDDVLDKNSRTVGIEPKPRITGKRYMHHAYTFTKDDIPDDIHAEMRQRGLADTADEAAKVLNDPEHVIPEPATRDPKTVGDRLAQVAWAQEKAHGIADSIEHARRGNDGYSDDPEYSIMRKVRADSRRLAEAAVFGPNLGAIDENLQKISGNGGTMRDVIAANKVMNDVRGRINVESSPLLDIGGEAIRLWMSTAGTRHLTQNALTAMKFGNTRLVYEALDMFARAPFMFTPGKLGGDFHLAQQQGATLRWSAFELDEHPTDWVRGTPPELAAANSHLRALHLPEIAHTMGTAGTAMLHVVLNGTRTLAHKTATAAFDSIYERALRGNTDDLACISDLVKARVTPEFLKTADRDALKERFAKSAADTSGITYRPQDMPGYSRSPLGKQLVRFKTFLWGVSHAFANELTNPNYSYKRRALVAVRALMMVPAIGTLDPALRHWMTGESKSLTKKALGLVIGSGTINSEVAFDAMGRFVKDPRKGTAAYMTLAIAINSALFGVATDALQGINTKNPALIKRSFELSPAIMSPIATSLIAGSRAGSGVLNSDSREFTAGMRDAISILGPGAVQPERAFGKRGVRLQKKMLFRKALQAGS